MDGYLDKSPNAGRKGKAAELLVAAHCILVSGGELNVSTSYVDDEGVDLVFHRRGSSITYAVQVKTRFSSASTVQRGRILADVRTQTFTARPGLGMLFVVVDDTEGRLIHVWLVPSCDFLEKAGKVNSKGKHRFSASSNPNSADMWAPYRLAPAQLPQAVLEVLKGLESGYR